MCYYEIKYNDYEDRASIKDMLADALRIFKHNYITSVYEKEPNEFWLYLYRELKTFDIRRIPTEDLYAIYGSYDADGVIYLKPGYRSVPDEYKQGFRMPKYNIY